MNCVICQLGTTGSALVTVTVERDGVILVVKDVPADVCTNCGEQYFDAATTDRLLAAADRAFTQGAELEVIRLQAA